MFGRIRVNSLARVIEPPHWDDPSSIVIIMTDAGTSTFCRDELSVCRDQTQPFVPMRHRLPYGRWTCDDGREVLFNRDYKPIWSRKPGQEAEPGDPDEWVKFNRQEWFYKDHNPPWASRASLDRCERILAE